MQLFPTAFWKHGFTNIPDGEDSCYECINTTVLDADDNSYRLKIATTPDAEGDDGVGLYKDYIFSEIVVSEEGLPFAHLNRADGKKTDLGVYEPDINAELPEGDFPECWKEGEKPYEFVSQEGIDNPDGTCCNDWLEWLCKHVKYYGEKAESVAHQRKANQKGVVYATKPPILYNAYGDGLKVWKGWEEFWTQHLNNTSGVPTESSILDHWLYIWTEKSTFRYSGVDYPLHKTSPVTITSTTDCKKATVTCYFEKDVLQKLYELSEGPATAEKLAKDDFKDDENNQVLNHFARWGFNGLRETYANSVNFYYRQKAKARLKFKLGSAKDLKIKIKGLGTDFHDQFPEASQRNIGHSATFVSRKYSFFDEDPEDQKKAGLYAITPDLIKQDLKGLNINPNENPNLYAQPGDVQSCTIFFDNEEKIKCVAPVLNYYESSAVLDLIYEYYPHQLKGPVRIFELKSIENNEDDDGITKTYKGAGDPELVEINGILQRPDTAHPVEGLGYIKPEEYPDGYGYSRWLESPTIINPYGEDWTENQSYFYDGGSNMITPDYYSPYEYEHTLNNVSAGEHTIDIVFDSVAEIFNGGAYYEIEISHT